MLGATPVQPYAIHLDRCPITNKPLTAITNPMVLNHHVFAYDALIDSLTRQFQTNPTLRDVVTNTELGTVETNSLTWKTISYLVIVPIVFATSCYLWCFGLTGFIDGILRFRKDPSMEPLSKYSFLSFDYLKELAIGVFQILFKEVPSILKQADIGDAIVAILFFFGIPSIATLLTSGPIADFGVAKGIISGGTVRKTFFPRWEVEAWVRDHLQLVTYDPTLHIYRPPVARVTPPRPFSTTAYVDGFTSEETSPTPSDYGTPDSTPFVSARTSPELIELLDMPPGNLFLPINSAAATHRTSAPTTGRLEALRARARKASGTHSV